MLALAWLLYQKRHSERAGDVAAFRWLRPVFRYGASLLSGLIVANANEELLSQIEQQAFQDGGEEVCQQVKRRQHDNL